MKQLTLLPYLWWFHLKRVTVCKLSNYSKRMKSKYYYDYTNNIHHSQILDFEFAILIRTWVESGVSKKILKWYYIFWQELRYKYIQHSFPWENTLIPQHVSIALFEWNISVTLRLVSKYITNTQIYFPRKNSEKEILDEERKSDLRKNISIMFNKSETIRCTPSVTSYIACFIVGLYYIYHS